MQFPQFAPAPAATPVDSGEEKPKRKRGMKLGKKIQTVEALFDTLEPQESSERVFLVIATAAGVNPETAKKRCALFLKGLQSGRKGKA